MRIAVVGAGIAGMASAWLLSREHEVVLYERNDYLGGHTHTHDVDIGGRTYAVDTGFIVFNPPQYPLLNAMFDELGVQSQPTTMSFSLTNRRSGLEYNATSLDGLFCQRRNLVSPRFLRMVRDILRFYREAPALLERSDAGPTHRAIISARTSLQRCVPRRSPDSDGERVVVVADARRSEFPGAISGAVHGQPSHDAGERIGRNGAWSRADRASMCAHCGCGWRVKERTSSPVRRVRRHPDHVDIETAARQRTLRSGRHRVP